MAKKTNKKLGTEIAKRLKDKAANSDYKVKKVPLEEATVGDLGNEEPATKKGTGKTVSELLDEKYAAAIRDRKAVERAKKYGKFVGNHAYGNNILFIGPTGVGKTSIINKWAHEHNIELISLNLDSDYLDFTGVVDIDRNSENPAAYTVGTRKFDPLMSGPDKILFIDEINKASDKVLKQCLTIISEHKVLNGDKWVELKSLLFTVAAMNPSTYKDREPLDKALQARLEPVVVSYNTKKFKEYIINQLDSDIEDLISDMTEAKTNGDEEEFQDLAKDYEIRSCQKDIAEKILENTDDFKWPDEAEVLNTSDEENSLNPRTLSLAILNCNGTREHFLEVVRRQCGLIAENYLSNKLENWKPNSHKANEIFDKDWEVKTGTKNLTDKEKEEIENSEAINEYDPNSLIGGVSNIAKHGLPKDKK